MTELTPPSRREALSGLSAATLILGLSTAEAARAASQGVFRHGVASGDPDASSLVLWTRVTATAPVEVEWEIAADEGFSRPLRRG